MQSNLELKARVASPDAIRRVAVEIGATPDGVMRQVDTYFRVSNGRLKLRVIDGDTGELIRYDRSETTDERVSQFERYEVADHGALGTMLEAALGIDIVVRKRRELFWYKGARVHLDDVENLGAFVEFEIPSAGITDPEALMSELRSAFSINPRDILRPSYSDLLRERVRNKRNGIGS